MTDLIADDSGVENPADGHERSEADLGTGRPNVARMWDYYLGGKDNYEVDREAARVVLGVRS
jgi:hypothetical protein